MKQHHLRKCISCGNSHPIWEGGVDGFKADSNGDRIGGKLNPIWNWSAKMCGWGYICKPCCKATEGQQ